MSSKPEETDYKIRSALLVVQVLSHVVSQA